MEHILRWRGLIGLLAVIFAFAILPANAQDHPAEEDDKIIPSAQPVQLPGRVIEALNLRSAPAVQDDTLIRTLSPTIIYGSRQRSRMRAAICGTR